MPPSWSWDPLWVAAISAGALLIASRLWTTQTTTRAASKENAVAPNMPVESRAKYGKMDEWEAAADELAVALGSPSAVRRNRVADASDSVDDSPVDEDFLRKAGDSDSHYGR